jgi:hypothetical protein
MGYAYAKTASGNLAVDALEKLQVPGGGDSQRLDNPLLAEI